MITDSELLTGLDADPAITVLDPTIPTDRELTEYERHEGAVDRTVLRFANRWYF